MAHRNTSSPLRWLLLSLACAALCACAERSSAASSGAPESKQIRIVRAKQLVPLAVLEQHGTLERALGPLGYEVKWLEFAAGPQQLEALNAGELDIASTAESPPIFAQAAHPETLAYLATTAPSGQSVALLVPTASSVRSVAELKGKKIAFQKASIGHYLTIKALESANLELKDVESVYLPPPDANAAFNKNAVDAWFVWEPFVTRTVQSGAGRILIDGGELRDTANFYTTTHAFAREHGEALRVFLDELEKAEVWSTAHPQEMAELLAPMLLIDVPTLVQMHAKYQFGLFPITDRVAAKQQQVADLWASLGLLPATPEIRKGVLSREQYAAIVPTQILERR